jgi:hypothetical protein
MMECATEAGLCFDEKVMAKHPLYPKPEGKIHESMTMFYRLDGTLERSIGTRATESIHKSAIDRWKRVPTYRPPNLAAYFKRVGDPG